MLIVRSCEESKKAYIRPVPDVLSTVLHNICNVLYRIWLIATHVHVMLDGQEHIVQSTSMSVTLILVSMEEPAL